MMDWSISSEAGTVAWKVVDKFFFRFSLPEQIHLDQGKQFKSEVIREITNLLQIKKSRTTPYHPQSDGLVEQFNRTLLSMLTMAIEDYPWDWEYHLHQLCYAYNTTVHPGTGNTPFFLMLARQARIHTCRFDFSATTRSTNIPQPVCNKVAANHVGSLWKGSRKTRPPPQETEGDLWQESPWSPIQ